MAKKSVELKDRKEAEDKIDADSNGTLDEMAAGRNMSLARQLWYTLRSRQRRKQKSDGKQKRIRKLEARVRESVAEDCGFAGRAKRPDSRRHGCDPIETR
jgi:hypothetical protein